MNRRRRPVRETVAGQGAALDVENPDTEQRLATLAGASPEQMEAAVRAAAEAFTVWGPTPAGGARRSSTRWRCACAPAPTPWPR